MLWKMHLADYGEQIFPNTFFEPENDEYRVVLWTQSNIYNNAFLRICLMFFEKTPW